MSARLSVFIRQAWCWWRGHDATLHMAEGAMWLRCEACQYKSPGWTWLVDRRQRV